MRPRVRPWSPLWVVAAMATSSMRPGGSEGIGRIGGAINLLPKRAPNEALVNALSMMSPYGTAEKQALLEAPDLKTRAEVLIAITEIELAKKNTEGEPQLQ